MTAHMWASERTQQFLRNEQPPNLSKKIRNFAPGLIQTLFFQDISEKFRTASQT